MNDRTKVLIDKISDNLRTVLLASLGNFFYMIDWENMKEIEINTHDHDADNYFTYTIPPPNERSLGESVVKLSKFDQRIHRKKEIKIIDLSTSELANLHFDLVKEIRSGKIKLNTEYL